MSSSRPRMTQSTILKVFLEVTGNMTRKFNTLNGKVLHFTRSRARSILLQFNVFCHHPSQYFLIIVSFQNSWWISHQTFLCFPCLLSLSTCPTHRTFVDFTISTIQGQITKLLNCSFRSKYSLASLVSNTFNAYTSVRKYKRFLYPYRRRSKTVMYYTYIIYHTLHILGIYF